MEYEIDLNIPSRTTGLTVYGDGEVNIVAQDSSYGDITVSFELEELEEMVKQAKAHRDAYQAYKDNNYEEVIDMKIYIGKTVKSTSGRNSGEWGTIDNVNVDTNEVLINFHKEFIMPDGFTVPDRYWENIKEVEFK